MRPDEPLRVPDFTAYITERTRDFTGREWVFETIDAWLANRQGPRYFLLTSEPGGGKSAIAARLVQFSHGEAVPPAGRAHLAAGFLTAVHFCSAGDGGWIDARTFSRSLAVQLARIPEYARA